VGSDLRLGESCAVIGFGRTKMSDEQLEAATCDLCASFQKAVVDVLLYKLKKIVKQKALKHSLNAIIKHCF